MQKKSAGVLSSIILAAGWFGLVAGLVEGAGLLGLQELNWLNWNIARTAVTLEILWISPLFNFVGDLLLGVLICTCAILLPKWPWVRIAVLISFFLMILDWLLLSGRISHSGALVLAAGLTAAFVRWYSRNEQRAFAFWRKTLPLVAAVVILLVAGVQGRSWWQERSTIANLPPAAPGSPNIVLVIVDTLRADHVSAYGYSRPTTPNVDRLAQQGVLFENAYSTSSWTLPSHASILSGRYPFKLDADYTFTKPVRRLPEALAERGYRTAAISANTSWFTRRHGFGPGFAHFEDFFTSLEDCFARTLYGRKAVHYVFPLWGRESYPGLRRAATIVDSALSWIGRDSSRPYFVTLNLMDVHDPYLPLQPWRNKFSRVPNPGGRLNEYFGNPNPHLTPEQLQEEIDAYDGGLAYLDEQLARLFAALDSNTLVIFTSDHGEFFGEHSLFFHRNALYLPVLHVPFIVHWKGHLPAGTRIVTPVTNASLPATILDLIDAPAEKEFAIASIAPLLKSAGTRADFPLPLAGMAKMPFEVMKHTPAYHGAMQSVIDLRWQFIRHEALGNELYDIGADPKQTRNLVGTPEGQALVHVFARQLESALRSGSTPLNLLSNNR